jgi:rsbT co-antagonist protein RsbR
METLGLDEAELASRLAFFELTQEDFDRLRSLQDFARRHTTEITEELYHLILGHPKTRAFFPDETTVTRVKRQQNGYFLKLFEGEYGLDYVRDRLRVGAAHERIGMAPKWYLGAYRRYQQLINDRLDRELADDPEQAALAKASVTKIIHFDMALAIDVYIAANLETTMRHKAAIRELSTPVIRVHPRVLLLPIVGTVDTQRAQQIMETVLTRVVEEQAKVIIIDIAGVGVVDTKVAENLIKTTASVRLLGANVILTGISASVAQTIVQLGVEITTMRTTSRLEDGIALALAMVGKHIVDRPHEHGA